jgi:hypothetical protein
VPNYRRTTRKGGSSLLSSTSGKAGNYMPPLSPKVAPNRGLLSRLDVSVVEKMLAAERLSKTATSYFTSLNESSRPSTPHFNNIYSGLARCPN